MMPAHFRIVQTDAEQPYHVRIVGGNGEPVLSGENLADEDSAEGVLLMLARMFGATDPHVHRSADGAHGVVLGCDRMAEVVWVDERAGSEPTC